ncbi:hypothetical protein GOV10_00745 [Candidatus Woesearchaeota archaeon]|nr:hypothetical protein [Candidatus Woesearchaeota archaeon]
MKLLVYMTIFLVLASLAFAAPDGQADDPPMVGLGEGGPSEDANGTPQLIAEQNKGEDSEIQQQVRAEDGEGDEVRTQEKQKLQTGNYVGAAGQQIMVQEQAENRVKLSVGGYDAETGMQMVQEQNQEKTTLHAELSNGNRAEIKVMPDVAAEKAMERLQLKACDDCAIELKEVGSGENVRAAYEVQAKKAAKFLGLFKTQMTVRAQIDAESGEVIKSQKPWWAFLASE